MAYTYEDQQRDRLYAEQMQRHQKWLEDNYTGWDGEPTPFHRKDRHRYHLVRVSCGCNYDCWCNRYEWQLKPEYQT